MYIESKKIIKRIKYDFSHKKIRFLPVIIMMMCLNLVILNSGFLSITYGSTDQSNRKSQYSLNEISDPTQYINDNNTIKNGFSSHLPIIVLNYDDQQKDTSESKSFDMDVNIYADQDRNDLKSDFQHLNVNAISKADNESREKKDFFITIVDEFGNEKKESILGFDASNGYYLIGSMYDRSLIRNYLGYKLAAEMWTDSPNVRFCEVLLEQNDQYYYNGVYLLAEYDHPDNEKVIKRTTTGNGIELNTYGGQNFPKDGYWEIPSIENIDEYGDISEFTEKLNDIDEIIYADNLNKFSKFEDVIDQKSFSDFFIINELMGNYTARTDAYYSYDESDDILSMGPVWNFERSLDNEIKKPFDIQTIRFNEKGYFERLTQSRYFINDLRNRYLELREDTLGEQQYYEIIDEAVSILGPAAERDWSRWNSYFLNHTELHLKPLNELETDDGNVIRVNDFSRDTDSYNKEIVKVKYMIRNHDLYMAEDISLIEAEVGEDLRGSEASYVRNGLLFIGFVILLIICIHIGRRRAE